MLNALSSRAARTSAVAAVSVAAVLTAAPSASAVTKLTHAQATAKLSAAGISWTSSGGCSNRNVSTCTSFDQVNSATIDGIITLKRASGCSILITGGTETGHASGTYSHWNGYKLDISPYTCISNYITGTFPYIGLRGDGARQYKSGAGNIYARESNHWDILYYNCGGC
ncbi:hypothetical protein [Knoellia subterranea]|uniref:Peptidoglycan-binding protein n=1 Tax=Knoellia subterranea KCTC 19937 TaxID=1385521 RepID=A0A0A0JH76_9MICO|nr:hypothetical protein [Knoellia subterranea]KGN36790.1 hypothetical protein N803_17405 [Knoellia subterranea KCTC 19937]